MTARLTWWWGMAEPALAALLHHHRHRRHACVTAHDAWLLSQLTVRLLLPRRGALARDGLQAELGWTLARYNDPSVAPPFRRNEAMIELKDFELWQ